LNLEEREGYIDCADHGISRKFEGAEAVGVEFNVQRHQEKFSLTPDSMTLAVIDYYRITAKEIVLAEVPTASCVMPALRFSLFSYSFDLSTDIRI
jgi:hypothetical protein